MKLKELQDAMIAAMKAKDKFRKDRHLRVGIRCKEKRNRQRLP